MLVPEWPTRKTGRSIKIVSAASSGVSLASEGRAYWIPFGGEATPSEYGGREALGEWLQQFEGQTFELGGDDDEGWVLPDGWCCWANGALAFYDTKGVDIVIHPAGGGRVDWNPEDAQFPFRMEDQESGVEKAKDIVAAIENLIEVSS